MTDGVTIVGIALSGRQGRSPKVQAVLSEFGEGILMRAGVPSHDRSRGLITLTMEAGEAEIAELVRRLEAIDGVSVRTMHLP